MLLSESQKLIPRYYTGILHPQDPDKELVIIELHGLHAICCYRNHDTSRLGIRFRLKIMVNDTKTRFLVFKDKFYNFNTFSKVW